MVGIAWKIGEEEPFKDAVQQASLRYKEEFGRQPSHILVDPMTAESLTVEGLTVVSNIFVGKSYTFLLYRG